MNAPRPRSFAAVTVCAALLACAAAASAHPGHAVPLDQLTRNAALVVEGDVTDLRSEWNADRTQIFTSVAVRVREYVKGDGEPTVRLRLLGGTVGDITLAVLGQAAFAPNEHVFLFLNPQWTGGDFPVVAGEHGKFSVLADPVTGRELLVGPGATHAKASALRAVRLASSVGRLDR